MKKLLSILLVLSVLSVWFFRGRSGTEPSSQASSQGVDTLPSAETPAASPDEGRSSAAKETPSSSKAVPVPPSISEDLNRLLKTISPALPRIGSHDPGSDEAAHHTSPELLEAGRMLGDLAEYLERRPEEFKSASIFYADCSADSGLMPAVRAVCYSALLKNKKDWDAAVPAKLKGVPPEVIGIASEL